MKLMIYMEAKRNNLYVFAAGVLPYAISNGRVWLLLGHERAYGPDNTSEGWCAFCGKREQGDSILDTATMELWEESLGVILKLKDITAALKSGNIPYFDQPVRRGAVRVYLMEISMRNYPLFFDMVRDFVSNATPTINECFLEKDALKWFALDDVCEFMEGTKNPSEPFRAVFLDNSRDIVDYLKNVQYQLSCNKD
jgi:hypothetical protein